MVCHKVAIKVLAEDLQSHLGTQPEKDLLHAHSVNVGSMGLRASVPSCLLARGCPQSLVMCVSPIRQLASPKQQAEKATEKRLARQTA